MPNIIDKFTSLDDTMKVNALLLQNLLKQQQVTNKLLALQLQAIGQPAQQIGFGEDMTPLITGEGKYKSFVFKLVSVSGDRVVFKKEMTGIISEIYFLSDVSDANNAVYNIKLVSDNDVLYDDSYSNLMARSDYEADMTAFSDATYYILNVQNIAFQNSIIVQIYNSSATFDHVYIKYHERVG